MGVSAHGGQVRYALISTLLQPPHHILQAIGMGNDVVQAGDFEFLFLLGLIEQGDVFLAAVEVQATDGFVVVVVEVTGKFLS
jgi:hypothetical protein